MIVTTCNKKGDLDIFLIRLSRLQPMLNYQCGIK